MSSASFPTRPAPPREGGPARPDARPHARHDSPWREADLHPIDIEAPATVRGVVVWAVAALLSVAAVGVQVFGGGSQALRQDLQAAGAPLHAATGLTTAARLDPLSASIVLTLHPENRGSAGLQAYPLLPDPGPAPAPGPQAAAGWQTAAFAQRGVR